MKQNLVVNCSESDCLLLRAVNAAEKIVCCILKIDVIVTSFLHLFIFVL